MPTTMRFSARGHAVLADRFRNGRRLLHKPIRNPVHQVADGITRADDARVGLQLGEEAHFRDIIEHCLPRSLGR
jgi:hypothetical protein